ncbi:4'-phosphopantetheinyl transferase family protein [Prochlorococcus sp. MIT 1300]|uniref:4'-phosphopantetheinyl transferase family protein n=1 Tax=Prochlorococcus sp. MIT 1300 TaxID=3096218 RepID=UPI002A75D164|nr:4'-phosphopantetheinyl transferase superfamily protein [Prochlorococcus sp. MIT 1300]
MPEKLIKRSVLALWLFPKVEQLLPISSAEEQLANELPTKRAQQFRVSRGYLRDAMADLWQIDALTVPIYAPPGQPPLLEKGWGHISMSHCQDAFLVGWSHKKIGIDIERTDRKIKNTQLINRYFSKSEQRSILHLQDEEINRFVLRHWITKEACIKWQRSSIAKDFSNWDWGKDSDTAKHKLDKHHLRIHHLTHHKWNMAIAYSIKERMQGPMLCVSSN